MNGGSLIMGDRLPAHFIADFGDAVLSCVYNTFQYRYANGEVEKDDTPVGNDPSFTYDWGTWRYEDRFYGGEPYSGTIVIFFKGIPCMVMSVHGKLMPNLTEDQRKRAYQCLDQALKMAPKNFPFRGPSAFTLPDSDIKTDYSNNGHGSVVKFYGKESVKETDELGNETWLIEGDYSGQIINLYD